MKFPCLQREKTVQYTVNALRGGCTMRETGREASELCLATAENVWWQDGGLGPRPGFSLSEQDVAAQAGAEISWKFCAEDAVSCGESGRRFLRKERSLDTNTATFYTGIFTFDGRVLDEGSKGGFDGDTEGMVLEYPLSELENVVIFLSDGSVYAQNRETYHWRNVTESAYVPCLLSEGRGVRAGATDVHAPEPNCESPNLLSEYYDAKYTTHPEDVYYRLPYNCSNAYPVEARLTDALGNETTYTVPAGETNSQYINNVCMEVQRESGKVSFRNMYGEYLPMPEAGKNNLVIRTTKRRSEYEKSCIARMQFSTRFGGERAEGISRQFLGGCPDMPDRIYWSAQKGKLYFPTKNYISVGTRGQAVTAFGKQGDHLIVFKERELYSVSDSVQIVSADTANGRVGYEYFPVTQIRSYVGCMAPQTVSVCAGHLCWADGVGGVHALVATTGGFTVRELSKPISPALCAHDEYGWSTAAATELNGYYLLAVEHTVYAWRADDKVLKSRDSVYDATARSKPVWYVWSLPEGYAFCRLFSNEKQAAALVHREGGNTFSTICVGGTRDAVPSDGEWETVDVAARFSAFPCDFGDPVNKKRVLRLYVETHGSADAEATVTFYGDGRVCGEVRRISDAEQIVLTPHGSPVKQFAFTIGLRGDVNVSDIVITYRK